jgi:hypothetical protein
MEVNKKIKVMLRLPIHIEKSFKIKRASVTDSDFTAGVGIVDRRLTGSLQNMVCFDISRTEHYRITKIGSTDVCSAVLGEYLCNSGGAEKCSIRGSRHGYFIHEVLPVYNEKHELICVIVDDLGDNKHLSCIEIKEPTSGYDGRGCFAPAINGKVW